jgi:hypothetical protein
LIADPLAKPHITLDVFRGHLRVAFAFDEPHQCGVASVPPLRIRLRPFPARNGFEAGNVISLPLDSPKEKVLSLTGDPRVESHTILDVPRFDHDVAFALLERHKRAIAPLPLLGPTFPRPVRENEQLLDLLLRESAAAVDSFEHVALLVKPAAESLAFL